VPLITLTVAGRHWAAIVDTGFNADLELPERLRGLLNERHVGRVMSALAGGQVIKEDAFQVQFPFDGVTVQADSTFVEGDEILIGTHLLRSCRLTIDFVARTVEAERRLHSGIAGGYNGVWGFGTRRRS
jgi:predicted aspartyl protease